MKGNIVVVNYIDGINFPIVLEDLRQPTIRRSSFESPDIYIVNTDVTELNQFLKFRKELGCKAATKYIFHGQNFTFQFSSTYNHNAIFINSKSGKIYNRKVSEENPAKEIGDCFEMKYNFINIFEKDEQPWKFNRISACEHKSPPYNIENDTKKGILTEISELVFESLKIDVKFVRFPYHLGNVDTYLTNIFDKNICDIYTGIKPTVLFDFTYPYIYDTLHWITKTPDEIPRWKYALKIFKLNSWLSFIFSIILISVAYHFTMFRTGSFEKIMHLHQGFVITLKLFLEQSHSWKTSNLSREIMFVTILFTSFMINAFCKTRFTYLLSGFNVNERIDSFEAIMANRMSVKISYSIERIFEHEPQKAEYLRKYQILMDPSDAIKQIPYEENTATALPKKVYDYRINQFIDEEMRPLLQLIDPPIVLLTVSMVLPKGDLLTEPLNKKLQHLQDHGHISYILSRYKVMFAVRDPTLDVKKLTINHIQLPLAILIIGMIASGIIFFFE
ncbi:hypothetical protein HHI36_019062 [Cryptolaemus montrouzieri]|uniref:Ionotropic receptor n=1 Tax=Cryptolaemus montrouzieri TaxID=559131 RepID=A0ABD2P1U5_9CUCU